MDYLDENNRLITAPEPRWITSPKRLRVFFGGEAIVDTTRANLFRGGGPPVYYFPKDDVRQGALTATGRTETNARGTMSLFDVRLGERSAEGAAWEYTETADDVPFLAGTVAFRWGEMDAWYEEEEEVFVHAKDPFKRIETFRSARHVEVYAGGERVADSTSSVVLLEPGHPLRYYLPKMDIRMEAAAPQRDGEPLPVQGEGELLLRGDGERLAGRRGVVLQVSHDGDRRGRRAGLLLQRAGGCHSCRRRRIGEAGDQLAAIGGLTWPEPETGTRKRNGRRGSTWPRRTASPITSG